MKKQDEIQILQSLKGHGRGETYFGQFFKDEDIDKMCENIKNDYPIEMETMFNDKAEIMENRIVKERKESDEQLLGLAAEILSHINDPMKIYAAIKNVIGLPNILKAKYDNKVDFTKEDIDFLYKKAKNYF